MRRHKSEQMELFSSSHNDVERPDLSRSPLSYIWNYEKIILIIIGFLIIGIVSFSLGVKRGKYLALLEKKKQTKIEQKKTLEETKPVREKVKSPPIEEEVNYTIQVATYKTKTYAQREADKLNEKGLKTLVLLKGKYVLLCVGKFLNKDEASVTLKKLKKRYQDCFIRRL